MSKSIIQLRISDNRRTTEFWLPSVPPPPNTHTHTHQKAGIYGRGTHILWATLDKFEDKIVYGMSTNLC